MAVAEKKRARYRKLSPDEAKIALSVGKRVTELREQMEISQWELGKRADLNQTTVSLIETGRQLPNINSLVKLSAVFRTDLVVLLKPKDDVTTAVGFANALLYSMTTLDRFRTIDGTEEIFAEVDKLKESVMALISPQNEEE